MSETVHFEDEDIVAFATHSLADAESAVLARNLVTSEMLRERLRDAQERLAIFVRSTVPLYAAPEGSLDRLLDRVNQQMQGQPLGKSDMPALAPSSHRRRWPTKAGQPWIGWVAAAVFAVCAGKLYRDRSVLHSTLASQAGEVVRMNAAKMEEVREKNALTRNVSDQAKYIEELTAENKALAGARNNLKTLVTDRTTQLRNQLATQETLQAEKQRIETTLSEQAQQLAHSSIDATRTREILGALSDRTALRVTLTKPRSRPAPTARATYVQTRGTLILLANDLAPLKPHKVYQLWLMPRDGSNPVPEATFVPDERGNVALIYPQIPTAAAARGFSVTIENEGGSLTPSLPIILAGLQT